MGDLTITEFLLARIAEDEEDAYTAADRDRSPFHPGRVLAECEAKRRIIMCAAEQPQTFAEVVAHMAEPYADHPDFDPSWTA